MSENQTLTIVKEANIQLASPEVNRALLATTFKGFDENLMRQAVMEGMIRGFSFKDFLNKDVYAIKYVNTYSLITSIDRARKIGMKAGIVGVDAPVYEDTAGKIMTCSVTVKRRVDGYVGEYTALVYFSEYYSGQLDENGNIKQNKWGDVKPTLWDTKPRTMIAKVAEMHALRKACPEELSQEYLEEEFNQVVDVTEPTHTADPTRVNSAKEESKSLSMGAMKQTHDPKTTDDQVKKDQQSTPPEGNDIQVGDEDLGPCTP